MKKLIVFFVSILVIIFFFILYMICNDNKYLNNLKKDIIDNTDISSIRYINKYDGYYIVSNNDNLYLFDEMYNNILEIDLDLVHENVNNYDIIYRDSELVYLNDIKDGSNLAYEYYDLYTYEFLDRVLVGG